MLLKRSSFACGALLLLGVAPVARAVEPARPNVLLIFTDDQRYTGVHALGGQAVHTPHMDRLQAEGISFDRTYLMGAFTGATCVPSRAMLMTGRNLFALEQEGRTIPASHTTIGQAFRQAGYQTHIVGKWHQDKPSLVRSFDSGSSLMSLGVYLQDHFRMPLWNWDRTGKFSDRDAYLLTYDEHGQVFRRPVASTDKRGPIANEKTGPLDSAIFADSAIKFIQTEDRAKPFFLYLAFHSPHDPRQAPAKYKQMYPEDQIALPPSYLAQHPFDNGAMVIRDEELAPWPRTPKDIRKHLSDYYAAISFLDAQFGRVIQALKDNGTYDNTLIVFSSDSGLAVGNHGLMGKQSVYDEDGIHVPFIVSGKLLKEKGRRIGAACYTRDIFPTICDLAGIPIPASVTGISLLPVINHQTEAIHDYTYHAYRQFQRAYRKGDYKLIEYVRAPDVIKKGAEIVTGSRVTQLFDVRTDPWEINDLSFLPGFQERVRMMRQEMKQAALTLGDNKKATGEPYDFWDYYP